MKNKLNIFGVLTGVVGLILVISSLFFSLAGQIISNFKLLSGDGWIPYIVKSIIHSLSPSIILKGNYFYFFEFHKIDGYISILGIGPFIICFLSLLCIVSIVSRKVNATRIITGIMFWLSLCIFFRLVFISRNYSKLLDSEFKNINYPDIGYGWLLFLFGLLVLFLATLSAKNIKQWAKNIIGVDLRTLGIFRIVLGLVCFIDVVRRIPYIEIFYSNSGVTSNHFMADITSKFGIRSFTLLSSIDSYTEVSIFFLIAAIFSFFLIIGYKTKLAHVVTLITVLSIHNRIIMLENGGDMVMNNILIWSLFLPLGKRFSIDRLLHLLRNYRDNTPRTLNSGPLLSENEPKNYYGLVYVGCLMQLSIIYFFNCINKTGSTWEQGTSLYYFYRLDNFLTPIGNFIKEWGLMPLELSKILTFMTINLEMMVTFFILFPFLATRRISLLMMVGFHVIIGISLYIGTFSWIMIAGLMLLISSKDIDYIKKILNRWASGKLIVFYDSDCGFCHQTGRIIRRFDLFNNLTWAGKDWKDEKPNIDHLTDQTIVVWNQTSGQIYTRHLAFAKIVGALPFGFLIAWLFKIPGISYLQGIKYDLISKYRTSISKMLGYAACDISKNHDSQVLISEHRTSPTKKVFIVIGESVKTILVYFLIVASVQYAFTKNVGFRDWMKEHEYKPFKSNYTLNKMARRLRMIQKWNMFSPNTPKSYQWVIIEATLADGQVIDLLTGEPPVYDDLGYHIYSDIDNSQFWRKYFTRIAKKNYKKYRPELKSTLLNSKNPLKPYDDLNQDGTVNNQDKIVSVKLYKLSKSIKSPLVETKREIKVRKTEVKFNEKTSSRSSKTKKTKKK